MKGMSFFRYPGGKSKLSKQILHCLNTQLEQSKATEYREPFFGGGSVGLKFLASSPEISSLWLNDKDINLACLWTSVLRYPDLLTERVLQFSPTVADFYSFKQELLDSEPVDFTNKEQVSDRGFKKLAIHQISYSGLGTKSGSPLGGKEQKSEYKIDCRWSPAYIATKITKTYQLLSKYQVHQQSCSTDDFSWLLHTQGNSALIYLDPPYYVKGNELYQHGFTNEDHLRLARDLKETNHAWVLSYDDCPEVRELYNWAVIEELQVNYSITTARQKVELLIHKR